MKKLMGRINILLRDWLGISLLTILGHRQDDRISQLQKDVKFLKESRDKWIQNYFNMNYKQRRNNE